MACPVFLWNEGGFCPIECFASIRFDVHKGSIVAMDTAISEKRFSGAARWWLCLVLAVMVLSCGGDDDSYPSPPDLIGAWVATFTPDDTPDSMVLYLTIDNQTGSALSGTWDYDPNPTAPPGIVDGYMIPSDDGGWLVDLEMSRGGEVTCCTPLLGCYSTALEGYAMYGYLVSQTITDETANYHFNCYAFGHGILTVVRQQGFAS